jgi:hypothetical protein
MILTFQTQSYAPKDIAGFRFNPFFTILALLTTKEKVE